MKRSEKGAFRSPLWALVLAWVAVITGLAACSGQPPLTHYYLLEPLAAPSPAVGRDSPATRIGVRAFHVDPPYDQNRIVYRVGAESPEVGFYEYHRWAAPLHRMLPVVVASALAVADPQLVAEPVVPGGVYDAYLSGRLLRAEEVDLPAGQRIIVHLLLTLRDRHGTELWSAGVEGESTVETDSVARVVEEMRRVLDLALSDAAPAMVSAVEREL